MFKKMRVALAASFLLLLSGAAHVGSTPALASSGSDQSASDAIGIQAEQIFAGVPVYSVMKTETASLTLSSTPVNAFAPIALPCPATAGAAGCTFRVTVSAQFAEISALDVVRMTLTITGPGTLGPSLPGIAFTNVASNSSPSWPQAYSFQWVKRNIPAGTSPTITLQFLMNEHFGFGGLRTMSIDVMNGLI